MAILDYLKDTSFLETLTKEKIKTVFAKIVILDSKEIPIQNIEGRVTNGNLSINGNSSVRRTGNITLVAYENEDMTLTNVNHLLSMNKKIKIFIGIENKINSIYDDIIWFPLGIFVITQPNISHSLSGVTINLSFKDKMCLLNGECGGGLPASIIFHEYDQFLDSLDVTELPQTEHNPNIIYVLTQGEKQTYYRWDSTYGWVESSADQIGTYETRPQKIFDIIRTLVANYGGEDLAKIIINDVPLEIKSLVRYTGANSLYYLDQNKGYSLSEKDPRFEGANPNDLTVFDYNDDIGYVYTEFTYPGELVSGIGENVVSVLDKIKNTLGNYEYFYDIDGNFVFQEIKNYLNTSHVTDVIEQNSILNNGTYKADFNNSYQSVFTFEEGSELISAYSNAPNYLNVKNDFHIWGESDDERVIHYHIAIKEKPTINTYYVKYKGETGIKLATVAEILGDSTIVEETWKPSIIESIVNDEIITILKDWELNGEKLTIKTENIVEYTPKDWRVELYLRGLTKRSLGQRPDIYEQEVLDYLDSIYDFQKQEYKVDIVKKPNALTYYIDFLEPTDALHNFAVDVIGPRIHSYQQDNINKLYNTDVPNNILINVDLQDSAQKDIVARCTKEGQPWTNVSSGVYKSVSIGTAGYTAQETARNLLYQYTHYNEQISLQCIPIYYLDANTRISVYDKAANIYGDYIINSISLPLSAHGQMSLSAVRASDRNLSSSDSSSEVEIETYNLLDIEGSFKLVDSNAGSIAIDSSVDIINKSNIYNAIANKLSATVENNIENNATLSTSPTLCALGNKVETNNNTILNTSVAENMDVRNETILNIEKSKLYVDTPISIEKSNNEIVSNAVITDDLSQPLITNNIVSLSHNGKVTDSISNNMKEMEKINIDNNVYLETSTSETLKIESELVSESQPVLSFVEPTLTLNESITFNSNIALSKEKGEDLFDRRFVQFVSGELEELTPEDFGNITELLSQTLNKLALAGLGDTSVDKLKKIELPDSIHTIGVSCFNDPMIEEIIMPSNINSIGQGTATFSTSAIIDFSKAQKVPTIYDNNGIIVKGEEVNAFNGVLKIIVPSKLLRQWKNHTQWSKYADKILTS